MNDELKTLELECGVTLELQAVNDMLLLDLMENIKPGEDGKVSMAGMTVKDLNRMMKFFCGWGVKNSVPADVVDEVSIFGNGERVQRAAWVRMIATLPELTQIFAQVMALTQMKAQLARQPNQPRPKPEQDELDELRAKVAQLESEKTEDGK